MRGMSLALGVLGSGKGSNFVAIADAIASGTLDAEIVVVLSDVPGAGILAEAGRRGIPAGTFDPGPFRTRLEADAEQRLADRLRAAGVELVVLAGFMRMLKEPMLSAFPRRIINIHPSLLPKHRGLAAWKQALAAGDTVAGCTVHFVDGGMDTGAILGQAEVPVLPDDTPEALHARIQAAEHRLYPEIVGRFARGEVG
jgi:phosphoribosylglycinamide formyltransferase-1